MEVIILGANTLYSVFFKALLPKQVWSAMVGKGLLAYHTLVTYHSSMLIVWTAIL